MTASIKTTISGHTVEYVVSGTWAEVSAAIQDIYGQYPTPGYGTWFNWPPNGPNKHYYVPTVTGRLHWEARGHRSTSCD